MKQMTRLSVQEILFLIFQKKKKKTVRWVPIAFARLFILPLF